MNYMSNKQVIDAIHEGLPVGSAVQHDGTVPNKVEFARDFARAFSAMEFPEELLRLNEREIRLMHAIVREASSIRGLVYELRLLMANPLLEFIKEKEDAGKDSETQEKHDLKRRLWERLQLVKPHFAQQVKDKNQGCDEKTLHLTAMHWAFLGGTYNGAYVMGAAMCIIPELYQREHNEAISPEAWKEIGASALPFSRELLTSQMEVFDHGIIQALTGKSTRPPAPASDGFDLPGLDATALLINDANELRLHPSIIEPTRARLIALLEGGHIHITGERVGCPARGIFKPIHARFMDGAEKALFPFAEHILSLPYE